MKGSAPVSSQDTDVAKQNGPILDDQWLGILLETGILGALSLAWMFLRFIRLCGREAKEDHSPRGWLLASITASVAAFAVGMFLYDAFSFIQVTFLLFIFMGLGRSVLLAPEWVRARKPAATASSRQGRGIVLPSAARRTRVAGRQSASLRARARRLSAIP